MLISISNNQVIGILYNLESGYLPKKVTLELIPFYSHPCCYSSHSICLPRTLSWMDLDHFPQLIQFDRKLNSGKVTYYVTYFQISQLGEPEGERTFRTVSSNKLMRFWDQHNN